MTESVKMCIRDRVKDELQAFQLGADEYLTKPCRHCLLYTSLVREQVNNFLHGHPSTDDLCLDFIAYIHLEKSSLILFVVLYNLCTPKRSRYNEQ